MRTFIPGIMLAVCFMLSNKSKGSASGEGAFLPGIKGEKVCVIKGRITDSKGNPLENIVLKGLPEGSVTVLNGVYAVSVSSGWNGTVTPVKKGYSFFPVKRDYFNIQRDTTDQDFATVVAHPAVRTDPDSVVMSQMVISSVVRPGSGTGNRTKIHPSGLVVRSDTGSDVHSLGCVVPDSIVRYWRDHRPVSRFKFRDYPLLMDWSKDDSPVKDQGVCGACWAFAATALVENLGIRDDLSEQYIISCTGAGSCNGGYYDGALHYYQFSGVPDESFYPYTQTNGNCIVITMVPSYKERIKEVSPTLWGIATVEDLKEQLQTGPLVVRMLVPSEYSFYYYGGGVYHYQGGQISQSQGHAVLLVGYDDLLQCFKCKNSWGRFWGEEGYFRISYDEVTSAVEFGSYAVSGKGAYTEQRSNIGLNISNVGVDDLVIDSISSNKNWLSTLTMPQLPFVIQPNKFQNICISVNWDSVGSTAQYGELVIVSNDPERPSHIVKVTARPLLCIPAAPKIGTIVQPTCTHDLGSIDLYDLPQGNWTLTGYPGGIMVSGTGNNTTITNLRANTYYFTVKNEAGCTSDHSPRVTIDSISIPEKPVISYTDHVLLSNVAEGNQWFNQDGIIPGAVNQSYRVTIPGDYYDRVTLGNCVSEKSNIINAKITGIYQRADAGKVRVYPNPMTHELNIEFTGNRERTNFEILNSTGKIIYHGSLIEKTIVRTTGFPGGIYLLKLQDKQGLVCVSIIKNE